MSGPAPDLLARIRALITGRRTAWAFALVPLLLAGAAAGVVGEAGRTSSPLDSLPRDADSTIAAELQDRLPEDASTAVVLFTADQGKLDPGAVGALQGAVDDVRTQLELPPGPPVTPSEDGTAALAVVPVPQVGAAENAELVGELRDSLDAAVPDGVTAQVTGPAAVQADLAAVFDGANTSLLLTTALVVAVLLLLTYRSPVLWLIPLTVVGVADRLAAVLATHVLAAVNIAWDESTIGILSVLVFGAGTDYALLLISRYRDELRHEENRFTAMAHALRRTAEAVLSSSVTVVLGLLTLLLSLIPSTRGLGLACAIGVLTAASFVLVVLPAALVVFGRWIFWPKVPRVGQQSLVESRTLWHRVGDAVAVRPAVYVVGSAIVLGVLALNVLRIDTGLGPADQFLEKPEAIAASERLAESFPAGTSDPVQVLTRGNAEQVLSEVRDSDGVRSAQVSRSADGITEITAVIDAAPGSEESTATVIGLRAALADLDQTYVGGTQAQAVDATDAAARDRMVILPLIVVLVLGALILLLRSLLAPFLLVLTVLATYLASLGLSWLVFTQVLGFPALDVGVPLLAFLFLVALGVDYNIFLVTRAKEEAAAHGSKAGMLRALTATGGVITSAGILLAAVFAVLGVLPLVVLAQLGVVICIGVLLDTLLVRTVVVPALGVLLGETFWWPRRVSGDHRDGVRRDAGAGALTPAGRDGRIGG
ncbi:MMPL family transporter [Nocardioides mesophilus]|uniref:MMPL family transporter n=1 Tax=Nocardioides mesophilus TaxID=433659 RepID=A0A7G9RFJ7_9ACTN|nr:MMPL family transporter [Nocardioides mesophilus]QNN54372.1 MMPL family transporter [Nocardioides mesophilus]